MLSSTGVSLTMRPVAELENQTGFHTEPAGSFTAASPARRPYTSPSSSEFDASRLDPITPVRAHSPAAYRPGMLARPSRSVRMPPM